MDDCLDEGGGCTVMVDGVHAELVGQDAFKQVLDRMAGTVAAKVVARINSGALVIAGDAARSIQNNSGSFKDNGRGHFSSTPDSPPNSDTGNLAGRIRVSKKATKTDPSATVSSFATYSTDLEFGTRDMEARPFMGPSLAKNIGKIEKDIARAIREGLKEGDS